jgi:hypothetical protein
MYQELHSGCTQHMTWAISTVQDPLHYCARPTTYIKGVTSTAPCHEWCPLRKTHLKSPTHRGGFCRLPFRKILMSGERIFAHADLSFRKSCSMPYSGACSALWNCSRGCVHSDSTADQNGFYLPFATCWKNPPEWQIHRDGLDFLRICSTHHITWAVSTRKPTTFKKDIHCVIRTHHITWAVSSVQGPLHSGVISTL